MKKTALFLLSAVFVLAFAASVRAQDREAVVTAAPEPAVPETTVAPAFQAVPTPAPKPVPVLRTELINLKYANIETVTNLLRAYQSNVGRVSPGGRAENTIVITDTPEIVEKMLAIVRDIDFKPAEIQYAVQLIQGSETDEKGDETLKNDPIIRELRSVLKYKSFSLLDGTLMRVIDGEEAETKIGPKGEYTIRLQPKYTKDGAVETIQTKIEFMKPEWISQQKTNTETKVETREVLRFNNDLIKTTLQLKTGEKTVVGVSKSDADSGLILILSAKVVK
ncbi:MAG: hypothetical protein NTW38_12315 [Candidatus Aminicenantes bacterium]|nr:hypothetical protein [Candidatus Aminicenantes bacterium]